jgi:hypothetical protein
MPQIANPVKKKPKLLRRVCYSTLLIQNLRVYGVRLLYPGTKLWIDAREEPYQWPITAKLPFD